MHVGILPIFYSPFGATSVNEPNIGDFAVILARNGGGDLEVLSGDVLEEDQTLSRAAM